MKQNPLLNLADFLVEDIMQMSDAEILAEATPEDIKDALRARDRALEMLGHQQSPPDRKE